MTDDWESFVQAHGRLIGYDRGDSFMPVDDDPRSIRVYETMCARMGRDPGVPVYGLVADTP